MSKFSQIMCMIKNELAIRGAIPEDIFDDVDKLKTGYISYDAFNRALNSYNIRLRNQDLQELIINLTENGQISCLKFLSKMREISKEAQNNSQSSFQSTTKRLKSEAALIQLHGFLSIHQMSLRDVLRPYDKHNRGLVSVYDFIRAFASTPSIQARLIAEDFKDQFSDNVRYLEIEKILHQIGQNNIKVSNNSSPQRSPLIDQVISEIVAKNITDLRQFFEEQDYVKNGYVSKRALPSIIENAANIKLDQAEIYQICNFYGVQEHVNYLPFVQEIEQRIKSKGIDNNQALTNKNGKIIDTDFLIKEMKELFYGRRVNVPTLFPYAVNGQCSRYKFLKTLSISQKQLTADELNAIADRYDIGNSVIDLNSFLSNFEVKGRIRNTSMNDSFSATKEQIDVEKVLAGIKNHLSIRRLCLRRQCELFDRLRTGKIPNVQLLASLQRCGIQIDDSEYEAIINRFEVEKGIIDYIQICDIVDNPDVYSTQLQQMRKQQEMDQRRSTIRNAQNDSETTDYLQNRKMGMSSGLFGLSDSRPNQRVRRELKPPPLQTLRIVAKIADITRNREVYLRDEFSERDRTRHGTVNQDDFMHVISLIMSATKLTTNEIAEVFLYYSQNSNSFDYLSFCRDIEKCNKEVRQNQNPEQQPTLQSRQQQNQDLQQNPTINDENEFDSDYSILNDDENESPQFVQTIRKYKAFLASKMIQNDDIFKNYDQSRAGYIKTAYLASALVTSGVEMLPNELQLLKDKFSDKIIEGRFLYRKLGARANQEKIKASDIRLLLNPEYAIEEQRRRLFGALSEIREKLHQRRKNAFVVFGSLPTPTISPTQFHIMLLDVGIVLIPNQIEALTKKYTNGDMKNLDWHSFCIDCEKCVLIGNRENYQ